jgi:cytochrome c-type biogenesis protein CcmH/NrfG
VLDRAPQRAPIWVQLGHARKESGDLPAAEAAYRRSLALAPDTADTHLQLGHVLKLPAASPRSPPMPPPSKPTAAAPRR